MSETVSLLLTLLAGIAFGVLFFGGLWLTVNKGLNAKNPALLFMGSLILRAAITVVGFYYVGANSWQRMLVCLVGFLIARMVIVRLTDKDKQIAAILNKTTKQ